MKEWLCNVRKVTPYTAGEQPKRRDIIKLNTNECPYPPAPEVEEALKAADYTRLRLYPDIYGAPLTAKLAEYYGVSEDMVFVGVGSDDVISNAFITFFNSDKPVLFPDITYSFYPVWAGLYGVKYETVPLSEDFRIRREDYRRENGGIIFPNPNAPTSVYEEPGLIEDILKNNQRSVVIVDEAYIDFGGVSALSLVEKYDNLLVVQTFSKSRSMAGMRIGFAIGNRELISAMNDVKFSINSYTMNMTSIIAGCASLGNRDYFEKTCSKVIRTREAAKKRLEGMGFSMPDSRANFLFVTNKDADIPGLFEYLKKRGIYVRHWDTPAVRDYLRITIGTDEEMERLYGAVEDYMGMQA